MLQHRGVSGQRCPPLLYGRYQRGKFTICDSPNNTTCRTWKKLMGSCASYGVKSQGICEREVDKCYNIEVCLDNGVPHFCMAVIRGVSLQYVILQTTPPAGHGRN